MEITKEEDKIIKIIKQTGMAMTAFDIWFHGSYDFSQTAIETVSELCYEMFRKGLLEEFIPGSFKLKSK